MTINDLKTILVNYLDTNGRKTKAVSQEIVEKIIGGGDKLPIEGCEVMAFQINGTTVFVSEAGLTQPEQVVFVDLKSRNSFLQELE